MRYSEMKRAARRGLKLLIRADGFGRVPRIDTETLDMADCSVCMIGQMTGCEEYSGFYLMTKALRRHTHDGITGGQTAWNAHYGFELDGEYRDEDYERLTKAWRQVLKEEMES